MDNLAKLDTATRMLAEIVTIDDAKNLISLAEAARVYAKQIELGLEAQNHAAEIKLRAQRRAGEILDKMEKAKGGEQYHGTGNSLLPVVETYDNLGINKMDAHRWQYIAQLPEDKFEGYIEETKTEGKEITTAGVLRVSDEKRPVSYHISDDSYEWYTPIEYIDAAQDVMGGQIDLDPASSDEAQEVIQAGIYYTKDRDGLDNPWFGNVWLNPPYNMPLIEQFIDRVIYDYENGVINSAIVLTNNSTDTGWFHKLIKYPVCFTRGRIQFWNKDQTLATRQGQALFYLGNNPDYFAKIFNRFGAILKSYDYK